jgi:hypothetical protein
MSDSSTTAASTYGEPSEAPESGASRATYTAEQGREETPGRLRGGHDPKTQRGAVW